MYSEKISISINSGSGSSGNRSLHGIHSHVTLCSMFRYCWISYRAMSAASFACFLSHSSQGPVVHIPQKFRCFKTSIASCSVMPGPPSVSLPIFCLFLCRLVVAMQAAHAAAMFIRTYCIYDATVLCISYIFHGLILLYSFSFNAASASSLVRKTVLPKSPIGNFKLLQAKQPSLSN